MASELTAAQIEQINKFTSTTVKEDDDWDALIQVWQGGTWNVGSLQ